MNIVGNIAAGVPKIRTIAPMGDWAARAACIGLNPDLFHPERGASTREAKHVCATCAVRTDCLAWAMATHQTFGIWGGLSERERKRRRTDPDVSRRVCECCGSEFRARRADQRFCTPDCRQYHQAAKKRLR